MEKQLKLYKEFQKEMNAYNYALNAIGWDSETEAPKMSSSYRGQQIGFINKKLIECETSKERQGAINYLYENIGELSKEDARSIEIAKKEMDKTLKIPNEELIEYSVLLNDTQRIWEEAFANDNFDSYKENFTKIIDANKRFIKYREDDQVNGYNVLLDDFEEGMTIEDYDNFFDTLKTDLVPFVKEILKKGNANTPNLDNIKFDTKKQREFADYLMEVFSFDLDRGLIKESVHPFTWGQSTDDIRFTVKYLEDLLQSSIYSTAHELGHALYEQQINPDYNGTNLGGGVSSGIHESQSRFYENNIARSEVFIKTHYGKLKEIFPEELADISYYEFYQICNEAKASFIRIEADELTYCLHIMIRYEMEKKMFAEGADLDVDSLPKLWNDMNEEYLGIRPTKDSDGILQDIHWGAGLFGYFPTYALGSAIAAQIDHTMRKELDIDAIIESGNLKEINQWLKENIHTYGALVKPTDLLKQVTGEKLNPKYYVEYLKGKYSKLYK